MARRRRKTSRKDVQRNRVIGVVAVVTALAGVAYLYKRSSDAAAATFEQAMLSSRQGDGLFFFMWLVLYRARLIDTPLTLGDIEGNTALLMRGFDAAGLVPATVDDSAALRRALCTRYKERLLDGTLRPIPPDYSPRLRDYAQGLLTQWERGCLDLGVNMAAAGSLPGA